MKRVFVIALLLFGLIGCGGGGGDTTVNNPGSTNPGTTPSDPGPTQPATPNIEGNYTLQSFVVAYDTGIIVTEKELSTSGSMRIDPTVITQSVTINNVAFQSSVIYSVTWDSSTHGTLHTATADGITRDVDITVTDNSITTKAFITGTGIAYTETDTWLRTDSISAAKRQELGVSTVGDDLIFIGNHITEGR